MSFSTTSFHAEIPQKSFQTAMSKSGTCWIYGNDSKESEKRTEEMNGSEGSCGRRGWDSLEDFGERPADAAKDRFGTKDDSPADVQLG
jgi:hypothetical protein